MIEDTVESNPDKAPMSLAKPFWIGLPEKFEHQARAGCKMNVLTFYAHAPSHITRRDI